MNRNEQGTERDNKEMGSYPVGNTGLDVKTDMIGADGTDALLDLESSFEKITRKNPRLMGGDGKSEARSVDLKAILEISKAINSSLVLDDILRKVMKRAIELLQAERGFLMLLDDNDVLQFKTVHNIQKEMLEEEDFKISNSIADEVARTGKAVFASDAQADERFAKQQSILDLHLRSIMCVPLKIKDRIIGVIYLDNSSDAKIFLQSDLYLFELFAEQSSIAIENAKLYQNVLSLKLYNENVVDATPVGIIAIDSELKVTTLNSAAASILSGSGVTTVKYDPRTASMSFVSLWPEKTRKQWKNIAMEVLRTGKPYQDRKYYHQVGEEQKVLAVNVSLLDEGVGDESGLILVMEDTTDKAILENYVLMSERLVAKGEMAASIGHELNNYLTIISNNAELMKLNVRRNMHDKLDKNVDSILDNINKIKRFTDGLMDYSNLEADIVSYDLKNLIEELLFSLRPQRSLRRINVDIEIPPDIPNVELDVGQMHQVLLNLVNNAVDAIGPDLENHGKIQITASHDKSLDIISIEVTDNGSGIKAGDLEKIFEPRFTTKEKGHGLGLSNCRRIMESHSGTITAISDGIDGSTFRITLPVKQLPHRLE
ncbi:MAG: GAF domain-containing protein [candidate division Zixibacteria bacterium]|nr:GAF domain-containing protein [candidate division Zixibacteria bacterium]MBU1471335.1 GAF domain-containing protein [candidate division Zixibacteria bacterium]MBU2626775.1 GAF domain-containing protein [candidate division Zixibacteria bacterium]